MFTVEEKRELHTALFQYIHRCNEATKDYNYSPLSEQDAKHLAQIHEAIKNALSADRKLRH